MKQQTGAEMKQKTCRIIINADDFGQTESCTKAIYEAFESGLITDTTMETRWSLLLHWLPKCKVGSGFI